MSKREKKKKKLSKNWMLHQMTCGISLPTICNEAKQDFSEKKKRATSGWLVRPSHCGDHWTSGALLITGIDPRLSSQLDQCVFFRPCLAMCQLSHFTIPFICGAAHAATEHRWQPRQSTSARGKKRQKNKNKWRTESHGKRHLWGGKGDFFF